MKIRLQTFLFCLLCTSLLYGQRSLIDFEADGPGAIFGGCFGAGSLDDGSCFDVIENPDKSGVNTTDSVGVYIEPAEGETWMGVFFDVAGDPAVFTGDSSTISADVWMPNTSNFMFKFENPGTGLNHEFQPPIANTTTSAWEEICQDVTGTPGDNVDVTRLVIFFNFFEVPSSETTYYFDNLVQPGATMPTSTSEFKFGGFINTYPNPVQDFLRIADDNINNPNTFIVSDLTGHDVITEKGSTGGMLDVSNLPNGAYFLRAINERTGEVRTSKFLKI